MVKLVDSPTDQVKFYKPSEQPLVYAACCPLCGKANDCMHVKQKASSCWCSEPNFTFPEALLKTLPDDAKSKVCICRNCVEAFIQT
ncbi:cysteine-rich CWC family protein [Agaribacterium sp. ZY112]|uniref:cysteine-rich CWC family protein n=1 Tax=Agaribacterium sp. ZY112 TaxID=3233574 RepID=UPI003526AF06